LRYGTFFFYYLLQGVPAGFAGTAVYNYLLYERVPTGEAGAFAALVGLPWTFQFGWGPLIDRYRAGGLAGRRPWLLAAQAAALLASLGWQLVADPVAGLGLLGWLFFAHSVCASVQDTAVDATAISLVAEAERGRVNAWMRGGFLAGLALGAAGLAPVLRTAGFQAAALAVSGLLAAGLLFTFFLKEGPVQPAHPPAGVSLGRLFALLWRGLTSRASLRTLAAAIGGYLALSVYLRAFQAWLIRDGGWTDTALSVYSGTYGSGLAAVALVAAGSLVDRLGPPRLVRGMLWMVTAFMLALTLASPWWGNPLLARAALAFYYLLDPAFSVGAMPQLMGLCHPGVEGAQFTTYMALVNLSDVAGAYTTGRLLGQLPAPAVCYAAAGLAGAAAWWAHKRQ
jgi:MFS transporter, PAT family, beta-lactamase induction signal transducer AmpG